MYTAPAANVIASIAADPWGNLFFTDVVYSDQGNSIATSSHLSVLPYSATTGFSAPILLATSTNTDSAKSNDVLSAVAVDSNGTVYYSDLNGTYAFPDNPVPPTTLRTRTL